MKNTTDPSAIFISTRFTDISHLTQSLGCAVGILAKWTKKRLEEIESTEPSEGDTPYIEDIVLFSGAIEANFDLINNLVGDLAEELEVAQSQIKELTNQAGKEEKRK